LSEEQVPSVPFELLNGKPKSASFTLGVKTLGTPLNNLNGEIIGKSKGLIPELDCATSYKELILNDDT